MKKLSIAVETYNQKDYIEQTINSILNQNYWFEYEIIIGDDCSTDGTSEILDRYQAEYPNIIKVIHNPQNLGPMKNYYNVLKHCNGEYFMDCAGDDYWLQGKVETQIKFLDSNPEYGMCYGNVETYYENKNTFNKSIYSIEVPTFEQLLYEGNSIPALSVCTRKVVLDKYIFEVNPESRLWLMEDYPAWLWFSKKSKIKKLDNFFGVYRVRDNSISNNLNVTKQFEYLKNKYIIKSFFSKFFSVDIPNFDENRAYYEIYLDYQYSNYTKQNKLNINKYYNLLKVKTKKDRIKRILYTNKLFLFLYKCIS